MDLFEEVVKAKFDNMLALEDNWDGYGATTIHPKIILKAKEFVLKNCPHEIAMVPHITPNYYGVDAEWSTETIELQICFTDSGNTLYISERSEHGSILDIERPLVGYEFIFEGYLKKIYDEWKNHKRLELARLGNEADSILNNLLH